MKDSFYVREAECQSVFDGLSSVFHLCTSENHPIIFSCDDDFSAGMNQMGFCAKMSSRVRLLTFELMSNHIHLVAEGSEADVMAFFGLFKERLARHLSMTGRKEPLREFVPKLLPVSDLDYCRNLIAYVNRNGYVVNPDTTPFSYRWGANRFYFQPEAVMRYEAVKSVLKARKMRELFHSKKADGIEDLYMVDGYVSPLSFCDVSLGESLFRDAGHYFGKVSKNVETYRDIAKLIGESVFYNDDDLFSAAAMICRKEYRCEGLALLPAQAKIELAKRLRNDYNAGRKQLRRILKLDENVLNSMFGG